EEAADVATFTITAGDTEIEVTGLDVADGAALAAALNGDGGFDGAELSAAFADGELTVTGPAGTALSGAALETAATSAEATLSADDIEALEVGDVIRVVLDEEEPFDVTVAEGDT